MKLTRVHPGLPETVDLDDATSREQLLDWYRPPSTEWFRTNFVTSVTGSAAGDDGTSESLTSKADRRLLGIIRELADIVVVGAQSIRSEKFPLPKKARLAVVTSTGDLSGHSLEAEVSDERLFVVCPSRASGRVAETLPGASIIAIDSDDDHLDPHAVVAALRELGFASIVCEGGPQLVAQFVAAGLVDEVCLTTGPALGGSTLTMLGGEALPTQPLELTQLLIDDSSGIFARWKVAPTSR